MRIWIVAALSVILALNGSSSSARTSKCFSCGDMRYYRGWDDHYKSVYRAPELFNDKCNDPIGQAGMPLVRCSLCIVIGDKIDPWTGDIAVASYMRGCYDYVLRDGFNETSAAIYHWHDKNSCYYYKRFYVMNKPSGKWNNHELIWFCTCTGDYCNGGPLDNRIRPTIRTYPQTEKPIAGKCKNGDWSRWTFCTTTCGDGRRQRSRVTFTKAADGSCKAGKTEIQKHRCRSVMPCPASKCKDGDWTMWTSCTKTCGQGWRQRSRVTLTETGDGCCKAGEIEGQSQTCRNMVPCPGGPIPECLYSWELCTTSDYVQICECGMTEGCFRPGENGFYCQPLWNQSVTIAK